MSIKELLYRQWYNDSMRRAAIYARVSTVDGRQDPETQLRQLREYALRRGFPIVHEYVDHASGAIPAWPRRVQRGARPAISSFTFSANDPNMPKSTRLTATKAPTPVPGAKAT